MLDHISDKIITFTKKNDDNWILEHSEKYFVVSNEIKLLIEILQKNHFNLTLSYHDFINDFEYITENEFNEIVEQNLINLELDKEEIESDKKEKSFILYETKILSSGVAGKISKLIQPLYQPIVFWVAFTILFALSIYNIINFHDVHLEKEYIIYLFIIYIVTAFIHELGHIAACNKFTSKNGEVGIGIYFIFPVFYSNITPIWTATKQQRIITNLAGVYIQLYIIAFLYLYYLISGNHQIKDVISISTFIILYQLIPFVRTDGYWILSDLTNTPNLLPNSSKQVLNFFKNPLNFKLTNTKQKFEFGYGLFNQVFMIYILLNIVLTYKEKLITLPIQLIKTIVTEPGNLFNYLNLNFQLILISIVFYLIVINQIKRILPKKQVQH